MKSKLLVLFLLLGILGCSVKKPQIGKKSFVNEDYYIMKALVLENDGELNQSAEIYSFLYKKTDKKIYFNREIEDLFFAKKYNKILELTKDKNLDENVFKYRIFTLLELKKTDEAKAELLKYNKKSPVFYQLMSYIYVKENNLKKATDYMKSLYALNHSKKTLLALADLLIQQKKYNEALAYLRTHLKIYGCEKDVCFRLVQIYTQMQDFDNLAYVYLLLGQYDKKYALFALKLYMDNGNFNKALRLINKYQLSDEYKLILYETFKKYKQAANIAYKIYNQTKNATYLLKYATYYYEAYKNKEAAKEVIPKLRFLATLYPDNATINNFVGYLLIDYNINPKDGIEYVKKALEIEPDNWAYIDSLAWGYYKLKKCKTAFDIIKTIDIKDNTIIKHKKLIKRCLDDIRKNNKNHKRKFKKRKKH